MEAVEPQTFDALDAAVVCTYNFTARFQPIGAVMNCMTAWTSRIKREWIVWRN
jgi:hypothetical protein